MIMRATAFFTFSAALLVAAHTSAQTPSCEQSYLSRIDADLPDFIEVKPGQKFIDAVESTYGCSVNAATVASIGGKRIETVSGEAIGEIKGLSIDTNGENAYAMVDFSESLGAATHSGKVPLTDFDAWTQDNQVLTTFTDTEEIQPIMPDDRPAIIPDREDLRSAKWLDPVLRLILPPERIALEITSDPPDATIWMNDQSKGKTVKRSLVRKSSLEDIEMEKSGFERCPFSDAVYAPRVRGDYATLSCTLSAIREPE